MTHSQPNPRAVDSTFSGLAYRDPFQGSPPEERFGRPARLESPNTILQALDHRQKKRLKRKHSVRAELQIMALSKSGTSITLYAEEEKLGT